MTLVRFLFNNVDGASATNANSGGSITTSGGTVTYSSAEGAHGSTGLRINSTQASNSATARFQMAATSNQMQETVLIRTPVSPPAGNATIMTTRHSAGRILAVIWSNSGALAVMDAVNTITIVAVAGTLSLNTKYRIALVLTGGTTTAGDVLVNVYTPTGTTPISTLHLTNANLSVNPFWGGDLGTGGMIYDVGFDDMQMNDGAGSEIPAYVPVNAAPSLSLTANQNVSSGATVNVAATAADSDGVIVSYAWTYVFPASGGPTLTGASTATVSFTAGAAGSLYVLQCDVTDDGGTTTTATTEVRVPVPGATTQLPVADNGSGATWTNVGGASSQGAALADSNDATYIESPAISATETAHRWRWQPSNAKTTGLITLKLGTDAGSANVAVRLFEGTTSRQTWSQAVTSTAQDYTFTLSGGTVSAITDWSNLYVEVGATS